MLGLPAGLYEETVTNWISLSLYSWCNQPHHVCDELRSVYVQIQGPHHEILDITSLTSHWPSICSHDVLSPWHLIYDTPWWDGLCEGPHKSCSAFLRLVMLEASWLDPEEPLWPTLQLRRYSLSGYTKLSALFLICWWQAVKIYIKSNCQFQKSPVSFKGGAGWSSIHPPAGQTSVCFSLNNLYKRENLFTTWAHWSRSRSGKLSGACCFFFVIMIGV